MEQMLAKGKEAGEEGFELHAHLTRLVFRVVSAQVLVNRIISTGESVVLVHGAYSGVKLVSTQAAYWRLRRHGKSILLHVATEQN